jgi:hypothetical protein
MLDASSLIVTTIKYVSHGEAELFYWLACSTVKSICTYFRLTVINEETLTPEQFKAGVELLKDAGYSVADADFAWKLFKVRRTGYLPYVRALSEHFLLPKQTWLHELAISQITVKDSVEDSVFQPQV